MLGIFGLNLTGTDKFKTPARTSVRFSTLRVTPLGTGTNHTAALNGAHFKLRRHFIRLLYPICMSRPILRYADAFFRRPATL